MIQISTLALIFCAVSLFSSNSDDSSAEPASSFRTGVSFVGSWNCSPTYPGRTLQSARLSGLAEVGKKWLLQTEVDVEPATGYGAAYLVVYDATGHGLVRFDANPFRAATYCSSAGCQAHLVTMELQYSASKLAFAQQITLGIQFRAPVSSRISMMTTRQSNYRHDQLLCLQVSAELKRERIACPLPSRNSQSFPDQPQCTETENKSLFPET